MRYMDLTNIYNSCSFVLIVAYPTSFEVAKSNDWVITMYEEMKEIHKNET